MDLLRFKGPKASKMKSKWSLRREKRAEKREKSREEREESATEAKKLSISVTVYASRVWGGSKTGVLGTPAHCHGVGF